MVDALVGQTATEWGDGVGTGRVVDALIAGDQVVATDACTARLMGHDPTADWRTPPFHRDRNPLAVAAEHGFGEVASDAIDFHTEVAPQADGVFYAAMTDSTQTNHSWRRTMCEQALLYRDNRRRFTDRYAGEYILLQDGEVVWHDPSGTISVSRRDLAGAKPDHSLWFKFVDPEETEGEHFEVYERELRALAR